MKYCKKCVYPISAVNLLIEDDGICTSCKSFSGFEKISEDGWKKRKDKLFKLINEVKKDKSNYDCIIPVSGGKDSYFQTHVLVKEFNLKPLLVTYHGNNYLPEGDYNRDMMRKNFDADHIIWGPSVEVLKKLNRIGFKKMGDMNWHAHCGIFTSPFIIAKSFNIPLIFYGETSWDISGMYDPNDFNEFSARERHEHDLRGYEWNDFLNDKEDKLNENDLMWAKYPHDEDILKVGIRGIFLGNYVKWDPNEHAKKMQSLYNWKQAEKPFERTYRLMSNLDDRYENGVHDLMKFIKFGYGRCSDHASKDIRTNYLTRDEGIKLVLKYDHIISKDLFHWLDYVKMSEDEFWNIADTFRDPRVWNIENNSWKKHDIDGSTRSYGLVALNDDQKKEFLKKKKELSRKL